jgi:hypothetical protein
MLEQAKQEIAELEKNRSLAQVVQVEESGQIVQFGMILLHN